MREAACRNWRDSRCPSLVLLKPLIAYVFGASLPAVTMEELGKVRDGVMEVVTWAFGVVLEDDGEWPEPRAHGESKTDALTVAKRLAWFKAILRISFAARRKKECDVGHMLQKPAEPETDGAESEALPDGVSPELAKLHGAEVAYIQLELCKQSIILERDDQASAVPLEKGRSIRSLTARFMRHMRNAVNDGREHNLLIMMSRLATINRTALIHLEVVPQPGTMATEIPKSCGYRRRTC